MPTGPTGTREKSRLNIFLALKGEDFSGQTGCSFRFDATVTCGSTTGVFPL